MESRQDSSFYRQVVEFGYEASETAIAGLEVALRFLDGLPSSPVGLYEPGGKRKIHPDGTLCLGRTCLFCRTSRKNS